MHCRHPVLKVWQNDEALPNKPYRIRHLRCHPTVAFAEQLFVGLAGVIKFRLTAAATSSICLASAASSPTTLVLLLSVTKYLGSPRYQHGPFAKKSRWHG
jgi:hypothetical protein